MLERRYFYDENGEVFGPYDFDGVRNFLFDRNGLCFVNNFVDDIAFPFLFDFVSDGKSRVLCNRYGSVLAIRISGPRNQTRWIVQGKSWGVGETDAKYQFVVPEFLKDMWDMYEYVGVGVAPTPSSLGNTLMNFVFTVEKLKRQTCVSLGAELYLHAHSFGGVIQSPGEGNFYEVLAKNDMSSAYLSRWTIEPSGAAVGFCYGIVHPFKTYFAECEIEIHRELALGPFPVRRDNGRIAYPVLPGVYRTYLWKEQVEDVERAGGSVRPISGIGWTNYSNDATFWSRSTYWLRKGAPNNFIESCVKRIAVAAIGRHSTQRRRYCLVTEDEADEYSTIIPSNIGEPLRLFIKEEQDGRGAYLVHWNKYTIMQCNRAVYEASLPYAEQGRLVQNYVDSMLVVDKGDMGSYIRRHSIESLNCEPGTWLLEWRHNVNVTSNGFTSDEENRLPGVKR